MTPLGFLSATALAGLTCLAPQSANAQPTTSGTTSNDGSTTNNTTASGTTSSETLPRTAGDTPTMALLGLAAVGGALALRKRSARTV